jgi:hypothetical protein
VQCGDVELINILAERTDMTSIDTCLGTAINRGDVKTVKVLMSKNANPKSYASVFGAALRASKMDMVCALSSGTHAPSKDLVSNSLFDAVKHGNLILI